MIFDTDKIPELFSLPYIDSLSLLFSRFVTTLCISVSDTFVSTSIKKSLRPVTH